MLEETIWTADFRIFLQKNEFTQYLKYQGIFDALLTFFFGNENCT